MPRAKRAAALRRRPGSPNPPSGRLPAVTLWAATRVRPCIPSCRGGRDGNRCTVHIRPGERCPETRLLEIHHLDVDGDVLLAPDDELATVCRRRNPRGG
jgi:hypothetical protein